MIVFTNASYLAVIIFELGEREQYIIFNIEHFHTDRVYLCATGYEYKQPLTLVNAE